MTEREPREHDGPGVFLDGVASVTLYASLLCNARCAFCSTRVYTDEGILSTDDYRRGRTQVPLASHTLSLDAARAIYDRLKASGIERVKVHGGEPTVISYLPALIAYGVELGLAEQIIVTNGIRLADREVAREWVASGVSTIALSIYGADAATHDASLGVPAFEALSACVDNLVELTAGGGPSVTGQLILHAHNFRSLPAMLDYWYARGLRYFAVRLLRETENTKKEGDSWFFDLAELGPLLERTLDRARELPGATVLFPEIPLCLPREEWLGDALDNLPAHARLRTPARILSKNAGAPGAPRRRLSNVDVCSECELAPHCAGLESSHGRSFTGKLEPISLPERVRHLAAGTHGADSIPRLVTLLDHSEVLRREGVAEADLLALQQSLVRAAADRPELLARAVVGAKLQPSLARLLLDRPADAVLRFVPWSSVAGDTPIGPSATADLASALERAEGRAADTLRFIAAASVRLETRVLRVFGGKHQPRGPRGPSMPFLVFLYDDRIVTEQQLRSLL